MRSRRERIAMCHEEIVQYLASNWRVTVATIGRDGFPHLAPMNYVFRDGIFLMTTFRKSQKVKNLERDHRATLLVETGKVYNELRSVVAYTECEILHDEEFTYQVLMQMPGAPDMGLSSEMGASAKKSASKRVVLRFQPLRFVSWDHAKLHGSY